MPTVPFMWELRGMSMETVICIKSYYKTPFGNTWLPCLVHWLQRNQSWWHSSGPTAVWKDLGHLSNWWESIVYFLIYLDSCWVGQECIFGWHFECRGDAHGGGWISKCWKIAAQHAGLSHSYTCQEYQYYYRKVFIWQNWKVLVWEYASSYERRFFPGSAMEKWALMKTRPNSNNEDLGLTAGMYGVGSLPQPYLNTNIHLFPIPCVSGLCQALLKISSLLCADFMPAFW